MRGVSNIQCTKAQLKEMIRTDATKQDLLNPLKYRGGTWVATFPRVLLWAELSNDFGA
jgi:hypothetical protein